MIDYEEGIVLFFKRKGSVVPRAVVHATPTALLALLILYSDEWSPGFRERSGLLDVTESQIWNAMNVVIAFLLAFRTRQALGRFWEGTSLLHQMRGEWFDSVSCLTCFSREAKARKPAEVQEFRHTLIRLTSLMHGSALDEIGGCEDVADNYEVLDIRGLDPATLNFLKDCKQVYNFNRVEALQHMIQVLVTHNHHIGVLTIPPPILSRIYQTLSRGLVNLLNAKKIKDTMFPFPYAQVIAILLFFHSILTPVIMTQIVSNKVVACILSFVPVFGLLCLNFIAAELEMPFGTDENDLPLRHFQKEINASLLMLIHEQADHLPHTSKHADMSFEGLAQYAHSQDLQQWDQSHSKSYLRESFFVGGEVDVGNDDYPEKEVLPASIHPSPQAQAAQANNQDEHLLQAAAAPTVTEEVASMPMPASFLCCTQTRQKDRAVPPAPKPSDAAAGAGSKNTCVGGTAAKALQASFDKFNEQWLKKADMQAQELSRNTETMKSFLESFDRMVNRNTQAVLSFTDALPKELSKNTEVMSAFSQHMPKMLDALLAHAGSSRSTSAGGGWHHYGGADFDSRDGESTSPRFPAT